MTQIGKLWMELIQNWNQMILLFLFPRCMEDKKAILNTIQIIEANRNELSFEAFLCFATSHFRFKLYYHGQILHKF